MAMNQNIAIASGQWAILCKARPRQGQGKAKARQSKARQGKERQGKGKKEREGKGRKGKERNEGKKNLGYPFILLLGNQVFDLACQAI